MLMTVQLVPVNHKHRFSCTDILNSLIKSSTMENTVCLFQTVVWCVVPLYSQVASYNRNSQLPSSELTQCCRIPQQHSKT